MKFYLFCVYMCAFMLMTEHTSTCVETLGPLSQERHLSHAISLVRFRNRTVVLRPVCKVPLPTASSFCSLSHNCYPYIHVFISYSFPMYLLHISICYFPTFLRHSQSCWELLDDVKLGCFPRYGPYIGLHRMGSHLQKGSCPEKHCGSGSVWQLSAECHSNFLTMFVMWDSLLYSVDTTGE